MHFLALYIRPERFTMIVTKSFAMKKIFVVLLLLLTRRVEAHDDVSQADDAFSKLRQIDSMAMTDSLFAPVWEYFVSHAIFIDEREGGNPTSFTLRDSIDAPYVAVSIVTSRTDTSVAAKRFFLLAAKGVYYPPFLLNKKDTSFMFLNYADPDMQNLLYCYLVTTHEAMHFYSYYNEKNPFVAIRKWVAAEEYTAYLYSWQTLMYHVHDDTVTTYFKQMVYGYMEKPRLYLLAYEGSPFVGRAETIATAVSNYPDFVIIMAKLYSLPGGRKGERMARKILIEAGMVHTHN